MTQGIVKANAIWIWTNPTQASEKIGLLNRGDVISIIDNQDKWVKHDKGWSLSLNSDNEAIIEIKRPKSKLYRAASNITDGITDTPITEKQEKNKDDAYYQSFINQTYDSSISDSMFIKQVRGIHGLPYGYMPSVDSRLPGSVFGAKYAERILTRMPLLLISPGRPKFMKGYSGKSKKNLISYLVNKADDALEDLLDADEGRFYSFEFKYDEYYHYVNPMLQRVAQFLQIGNKLLDGKPLERYEWQNFTNDAFKTFVSSAETVAFYVDSETSINESFSTSTTESQLSSSVNSISNMAKEMQFLLGGGAGVEFQAMKAENYDKSLKEMENFTNKYTSILPKKLISNLTNGIATVATGGKMVFPEIWSDSTFSRSYSVSMKLRSPDADPFSLFMNIFVPLIHIICLGAPQQMGPNSVTSPFLIRAFYKGFFNCEMGIITNINITRGDKSKWTLNGLPTEVDVSIDIKDLYDMVSITSDKKITDLLSNTALLDYIANMCGININKPDIMRTIDLYYNTITNKISNIARFNNFLGVDRSLSNLIDTIYKR